MQMDTYLESVRDGVQNAAALADDRTRQVADQLSTALESTVRLTLVRALADAATEISYELAPSSVAVRMDGTEPRFDVTVADPTEEPTVLLAEEERTDQPIGDQPTGDQPTGDQHTEDGAASPEDEPLSRISLRIPQSLKDKVDRLAAEQGVSTNVWITQAIGRVSQRDSRPGRDRGDRDHGERDRGGWDRGGWDRGRGGRRRGWDGPMADDGFGGSRPEAPEGPPFPPGFPFGPRHGHGPRGRRGGRPGPEAGGNVQGWVR